VPYSGTVAAPPSPPPAVPLREAVRLWAKVAALSFGGPAGQIAVMHRFLVEEKRWISEERFLHALNYCMLLPGPEAQQLAIYIGWLLNRTAGGLIAGTLFVLPGFVSILGLSLLYAGFRDSSLIAALFFGLKPAVVAVVAEAVVRIGRRALKDRFRILLAALAFVAIFFFQVPFPVIVVAAGLAGYLAGRWSPEISAPQPETAAADQPIADAAAIATRPSLARTARVLALHLLLWWGPVLLLALWLGRGHVLVTEGVFFSKMAVVTFGGAYAVLAYVAQQAVEVHHWLRPGEMLDGLGMAETTPGPLIMVLQFVGFLGAWRHPAPFSPMMAGVLGSIITTWVTFVPCFLWIFLGAPYIESLRGRRSLTAALSGVTAAVVGVILNLAVWFSIHTLFARVGEVRAFGARFLVPDWSTLDPASLLLAVAAMLALFRFKVGMVPVLLGSVVIGAAVALLRG
jgi:chromate transporter